MIRLNAAIVTVLAVVHVHGAAFVSRTQIRHHTTFVTRSARDDFYHEPHFEVAATLTKVEPSYDKMMDCAHGGECTVQEMDRMIAGACNVMIERVVVSTT